MRGPSRGCRGGARRYTRAARRGAVGQFCMAGLRAAFVADRDSAASRAALRRLKARYPSTPPAAADTIVALAATASCCTPAPLHEPRRRYLRHEGRHRGFLMNVYGEEDLLKRLEAAERVRLHPLHMRAVQASGRRREALAINEVSLLREARQAAKIRVSVDGIVRLPELICDGVLVSTAAGSTAYNLSVHGPDHSARRRAAGADSDQRVPPAALARRAAAERRPGPVRHPGAQEEAGQRRRRPYRGARRYPYRGTGGSHS